MFNVTSTGFDKPLFTDLMQTIRLLPDTLEDEALDLAVKLEEELETIFNDAPPRGNQPFVWSLDPVKNAQGRRTWFWLLKTGKVQSNGKHYIRKGKPPRGARVSVEKTSDGVLIIFQQTWAKSGLIYGTLKTDTRLPGHKATKWAWFAPKYKKAQKLFMRELDSRILARLRGKAR